MLTTILATIALGQTIPQTASVVYPCFPEVAEDVPVRFLTHSATFKLDEKGIAMDSLSTFKNQSAKPVTFELTIPTRGSQCRAEQVNKLAVTTFLDSELEVSEQKIVTLKQPSAERKKSGVYAANFEQWNTISVALRPGQTRSLRVKWAGQIGRAGMDGLQRMVVYDTSGAANWEGTVGQLNVAIQYKANLILQVFAALPDKQWQVGTNGAFFKKYDYSPPKKPHLIFTYYPQQF